MCLLCLHGALKRERLSTFGIRGAVAGGMDSLAGAVGIGFGQNYLGL